jgi:AraC family transcriptional regulator, ethanolamine operon transcriptional activator
MGGTRLARHFGTTSRQGPGAAFQAIVNTHPRPSASPAIRRSPRQLIRRASDFLRANAEHGVRIGEVSRAAGISERALRNAFHREHGLSPKQYELRERLLGARRALRDGPVPATVTSVASRYGFLELGRFAGIYKHAFGETPSQTIKLRRAGADDARC